MTRIAVGSRETGVTDLDIESPARHLLLCVKKIKNGAIVAGREAAWWGERKRNGSGDDRDRKICREPDLSVRFETRGEVRGGKGAVVLKLG